MDQKEKQLRKELDEIRQKLADPSIYTDPIYPKLARRQSKIEETVALFDDVSALKKQIGCTEELLREPELADDAQEELEQLTYKLQTTNSLKPLPLKTRMMKKT